MYSIPLFENVKNNDNMCSICLDLMNDERISTFRKNHKQFLKEYNTLRYKKWKLYNKFRRAKMDISSLPVSIIKIHRK